VELRTILSPTQPYPAVRPPGQVTERRPVRRRRLFGLLCWAGFAIAIAPPVRHIAEQSPLLALAPVAGLAGGYLLLVQILLMSRLPVLERWLGSTGLRLWHRGLGPLVLLLVLGHVALAVTGRMLADHRPAVNESLRLLTGYRGMVSGFLATGLLCGIGILAVGQLRRRLPYEFWYFLHTTAYLVVAFSYVHEFLDGHELRGPGPARSYWLGLYLLVVLALLYGRVLIPLRLNLRHRLRVHQVVPEGAGTISIYFTGRQIDRLAARAGQYFRWRFLARGLWWQAHPFSLSAAPNSRWLRITVKMVGDHTSRLRRLRPGVPVFVEGPSGDFTVERRRGGRALLIAGGSGIGPIRALLEELPPATVVIYRASSAETLMLRQELDWLARLRRARVWYVTGPRNAPGPRRMFTRTGLLRLVPDLARRDVYLCGPTSLVLASLRLVRRLGVPPDQIHMDPFEL
jgi:predicted ferric reductase